MPRKHASSSSRSHDMFNNLLENPIPDYSPPSGSSSAGQSSNTNAPHLGFGQYSAAAINPFSIPFDDPSRDYHIFMYNQSQRFAQQFQHSPNQSHAQPSRRFQTRQLSPESEPEEPVAENIPEIVPEIVPESQPKKTGGRGKGPRVQWSSQECKVLAERWIDASENPSIGNSQTANTFWHTIMRTYNSIMQPPRSMDQLTSKWTKIAREVKIFNAIYQKIVGLWESGNGDAEIMAAAREQYKIRYRKPFTYESSWYVLKGCPKFFAPEGVSQRKRPILEDDDDQPIDLDNDDIPIPNPATLNNLFSDDLIRRPPGRTTSKKSARSSGSSDASSGRYSVDEAREEMVEAAKAQKATMKTIAEEVKKRTVFKAFKVLATPIPRDLPPDEYEMLKQYRESVKREFGPRFQPQPPPED